MKLDVFMRRRILRFGITSVTVAAIVGGSAWSWISHSAIPFIDPAVETIAPAKAGLVLGTSPLVHSGRANAFFVNRMDAAAALFKAGKVEYLIVSGNQAHGGRAAGGYDEPEAMRDALIARDVPADRIYRDYAGFHTRDSVSRAYQIFGQSDPIVVSQRFHVERAIFLARAHGYAFRGFPAADVSTSYGAVTLAREFGSRIVALFDAATARGARLGGPAVVIGVDPPS